LQYFYLTDTIYEYDEPQLVQSSTTQAACFTQIETGESNDKKFAELKTKSDISQNTYELYKKEFEFEWNIGSQHGCYDLFQPASEFDHFFVINTEMKMFD
jgi:hypothetical protein